MEEINCCICLEVSLTMTSCNHVLCKRCFKKAQTNPQANMQACPCCRRQDYTLVDIVITLNEEQKEAHYKTLMDAYNEDHAYVRPAPRAEYRPVLRNGVPVPRNPNNAVPLANWNARRAGLELNFNDAVRDQNFYRAREVRGQLIEAGWELNLVREMDYQALIVHQRGVWEVSFDRFIVNGDFHMALRTAHALEEIGWVMDEGRRDALEAVRLAQIERERANARAFIERQEAAEAARVAQRIARRDARRVERQEQRQIERDAAEAQRAADREAAAVQGVQPNNDGDIVLRDPADLVELNQRFNARTPAPARARVVLGVGWRIGDLPFNARPMLQCVKCIKKTRRVCGNCLDAYCCAHCNSCNGCNFNNLPAQYRREVPP